MTVELVPVTVSHLTSCPTCGFALFVPLGRLRVSQAGLYDDARFPGRCLLALDEHYDDLLDIDDQTMSEFLADLTDLRDAIRRATGAPRVNYAVLGNAEPHVHWHLVPRRPDTEPLPGRSPWQDPRPPALLPPRQREDLTEALRTALRQGRDPSARSWPAGA